VKRLAPIAAYAVSVFISSYYTAEYWVVGPVFAAAALAVNYPAVSKKFSSKHLLFIAASTLIYALVFLIANRGWKIEADWLDMLAGSATAGVVLGSILMPSVHAMLFGAEIKTVRSVCLWLIASWYAVNLLAWLGDQFDFAHGINYNLLSVALWQGIYLRRLKL